MISGKTLKIVFTFYAIAVCLTVGAVNPALFRNPYGPTLEKKPLRWKMFPFRSKEITNSSEPLPQEDRISLGPNLESDWVKSGVDVNERWPWPASPIVDETGVYFGTSSAWFYAFEHDGTLRWKFRAMSTQRGIAAQAVMDHDAVYFSSDRGTLYSIRKSDGRMFWSIRIAVRQKSTPVIFEDSIYFAGGSEMLKGYLGRVNRKTGEVIWQQDWPSRQLEVPLLFDSAKKHLFAISIDGLVRAIDSRAGDVIWSYQAKEGVQSPAIFDGKYVVFNDEGGNLTAIDSGTGILSWRTKLTSPSMGAPTIASIGKDKRILIVGTKDGALFGIQPESGKILWKKVYDDKKEMGDMQITYDENANQRAIAWLGCETKFLCALDASSGVLIRKIPTSGDISSRPAIFKNRLYVALDYPGGLQSLVNTGK